jgi:hypothetical protein
MQSGRGFYSMNAILLSSEVESYYSHQYSYESAYHYLHHGIQAAFNAVKRTLNAAHALVHLLCYAFDSAHSIM